MEDEVILLTKSKEQMRFESHSYNDDNTGWCKVCGRSEVWQAHSIPETIVETITIAASPAVVTTVEPDDESAFTTGPLDE